MVAPLVLELEDGDGVRPTSLSIALEELDGTLEILAVDPPDPDVLELAMSLQFDAGKLDASIGGAAIYTGDSPGGCRGDADGGSGTAGIVDLARLDAPSSTGGTDTGGGETTDATSG